MFLLATRTAVWVKNTITLLTVAVTVLTLLDSAGKSKKHRILDSLEDVFARLK